ncbi:hypothetical protein GQ43DRAFT_25582 [Delitschia confertaspora ATCC 74209]|uniref:Uncharacterized protein n=1 Tax=Delitschia confertaspora ATCC 74209 TaxID=1513339 RepID=A0A9P4MW41_9PLEO|nr:hypothetical protein GQ43DRAFT_25582 [Delitschia confertaspora ATCC 74209]
MASINNTTTMASNDATTTTTSNNTTITMISNNATPPIAVPNDTTTTATPNQTPTMKYPPYFIYSPKSCTYEFSWDAYNHEMALERIRQRRLRHKEFEAEKRRDREKYEKEVLGTERREPRMRLSPPSHNREHKAVDMAMQEARKRPEAAMELEYGRRVMVHRAHLVELKKMHHAHAIAMKKEEGGHGGTKASRNRNGTLRD